MRELLYRWGWIKSPMSKTEQIAKLELQVLELLSEATVMQAKLDSLETKSVAKPEAKPIRRRRKPATKK